MARQVLENGVILPAEYSDDWYDDMTSNLTKLDDVIGSDSEKLSSADVGAAALSNNYNDLDNLPTIPTVNDATLTIQKNGVDVQTFTANASSNVTANITVPTKTSDLTNDSNFVDTSNSAVSSGITSAKVTDYDTHIADTDIHVTTSDKATWNTVTSKANDSDVVHKSGDETISGTKTFSDNPLIGSSGTNVIISNAQITANKLYSTPTGSNESYLRLRTSTNYTDSSPTTESVVVLSLKENAYSDGKKSAFFPNSSNLTNLGILGKRWANVYATNYYYGNDNVEFSTKFVTTDTNQTINGNKTFSSINGVEPSSLSLPSGDASNFIDISSYFANTGTGDTNSYTASANGWIYLRLGDLSDCQATVLDANNNRMWGQSVTGNVEQITIFLS